MYWMFLTSMHLFAHLANQAILGRLTRLGKPASVL
jgi:hypothetical protein